MNNSPKIKVEIVYGDRDIQIEKIIYVKRGTKIFDAIKTTNILDLIKYNLDIKNIFVWGKKVKEDYCLKNFDRIELCKPLHLSPNELRLIRHKIDKNKELKF